MSGGIFISYRRQETGDLAGRLYDRLADRFGEARVFMTSTPSSWALTSPR